MFVSITRQTDWATKLQGVRTADKERLGKDFTPLPIGANVCFTIYFMLLGRSLKRELAPKMARELVTQIAQQCKALGTTQVAWGFVSPLPSF